MSDNDLIARACETNAGYLALGNECFVSHGATFVRNRGTPHRYDANHVGRIRTLDAGEIDGLLRQADIEFEGLAHRRFDIDPLTPPEFVARLALDGSFTLSEGLHMLLEGDLRAAPIAFEIREVLTDADWTAYDALDRMWWQETVSEPRLEASMRDANTQKRLKSKLGVRYWLACVEDEARSFLASWPGEDGVGMVEDLFTHPAYRHRGLVTALLKHCVAEARARGAGPVVIGADPNDTPKQMYAALGFRPLFVSRSYLKNVPGE